MVEPHLIGTGRGKRLWLHAVATARERGATVLTITSDPSSEWFYQAMGAVTVGPDGQFAAAHAGLAASADAIRHSGERCVSLPRQRRSSTPAPRAAGTRRDRPMPAHR